MRKAAVLILLLTLCMGTTASAQRLSEEQLKQGLVEMRAFKHKMLIQELKLTREQQNKFFPLYDQMDDELFAIGRETRQLEHKVKKDEKSTDTEYLAAARTMFDQRKRESEVELKYFDRFAQILTAKQMAQLKPAERKISMRMAQYHGHKKHQKKVSSVKSKHSKKSK